MKIFQAWIANPLPEWRRELIRRTRDAADEHALFVDPDRDGCAGPDVNYEDVRPWLTRVASDPWAARYASRGAKYKCDLLRAMISKDRPGWWYVDTDIELIATADDFDRLSATSDRPWYAHRIGGADIDLFRDAGADHIGLIFRRLREGGLSPESVTPAVHVLSDPGVLRDEIALIPPQMFRRYIKEGTNGTSPI